MGIVYYSSKTTVLADLLFSKTHPPSSSVMSQCSKGAAATSILYLTWGFTHFLQCIIYNLSRGPMAYYLLIYPFLVFTLL